MESTKQRFQWLPWSVIAAFGALLVILLIGHAQPAPVYAQGTGLQVEKSLLKNSNVVRVGETLTFAITVTNNWNTAVITLPMIDNYDESVMRFLDATPAQDTHIASTGVISWNNILASTGPLSPGDQIVIYVRFIAEHPSPRVVNAAYTHDAYDYQGNAVGDGAAQDDNIAMGGNTPLTKTLGLGVVPVAGELVTFNLTIRNDGAANILNLPVRDRFDPGVLEFVSAVPPIDGESSGVVVWSNVLRPPLQTVLLPDESVVVTVTFRVIGDIQQTTNQAEVLGATDSFGNNLAPAADDVPIQIIPNPNATATPTPVTQPTIVLPATEVPAPQQPTATSAAATATATTVVSATAVADVTVVPTVVSATATPTAVAGGAAPISLPDTGRSAGDWVRYILLLVAAVLVFKGSQIAQRRSHK